MAEVISELKTYVYIGGESEIDGVSYKLFGQRVKMGEAKAHSLITATPHAKLLPEELFDELGFEPAELAKYPARALHVFAPPEFQKLVKQTDLAFDAYRAGLLEIAQTGA